MTIVQGASSDSSGRPRSRVTRTLRSIKRLGGGRAEADEHLRAHDGQLGIEPWPAGGDVLGVGPLVDAALAA